MAFEYTRKGPFIDVDNPRNPPPGAKKVLAGYLNGVEDALVTAAAESATYASKDDLALAGGTGLVEDPARPGIYLMTAEAKFTEDPARPGIYTFGV